MDVWHCSRKGLIEKTLGLLCPSVKIAKTQSKIIDSSSLPWTRQAFPRSGGNTIEIQCPSKWEHWVLKRKWLWPLYCDFLNSPRILPFLPPPGTFTYSPTPLALTSRDYKTKWVRGLENNPPNPHQVRNLGFPKHWWMLQVLVSVFWVSLSPIPVKCMGRQFGHHMLCSSKILVSEVN